MTKREPSPGRNGYGTVIPGLVRTEFSVRVDRILKGGIQERQAVVVVLTGGTVEGERYEAEGMQWLLKDEVALMYLSKAEDGKYYPMAGSASLASKKVGSTDTFVFPETVFSNNEALEVREQDL